jgi:molybdopterin-containing oxidoreductase family iron-sulfur binding subunit
MSLLKDKSSGGEAGARRGKRYWRSLEHLEQTSQFETFLQREFPQGASEMLGPFSRRAFLNLMAASIGLAGAVGCRRPRQTIMPYTRRPEDLLPGVAQHFATSMERDGQTIGLLVESHEGRPTKIEGLPEHPVNRGTADAMTQGEILQLYDPDRSAGPLNGGRRSTYEAFDRFFNTHAAKLRAEGGRGMAILAGRTASPSRHDLRERVAQILPQAAWHVWEPVDGDHALEGARLLTGKPCAACYDFGKADVVVALENDFLASGPDHLRHAREFIARRRGEGGNGVPSRMYAVEANFSLTGAKADHRRRMPVSQVERFALALSARLVDDMANRGTLAPEHPLVAAFARHKDPVFDAEWLDPMIADLLSHRGRALLVPGPALGPVVHAACMFVNAELGRECVRWHEPNDPAWTPAGDSLRALVDKMNQGSVQTLLILGGNPVYDAPAELDFDEALQKVPDSIHLGLYADETAETATWHVPRAHFLESWGDLRSTDGTLSFVQPLIAPLFDGRTDGELLAQLADLPERTAYDIVREFHRAGEPQEAFVARWRTMLHDGVVEGSARPAAEPVLNVDALAVAVAEVSLKEAPTADALELVFLPDPNLHDGRYANNGWLQETPDPTSKVTWDNCAYLNLTTAAALGVTREDVIRLERDGRSVELPVWIQPGLADNVIVAHLGYGRRRAGRVGDGVGVDLYPLRTLEGLHYTGNVTLTKTGATYPIACVQDHWAMEGRDLVREKVFGEAHVETHGHGNGAESHHDAKSLWNEKIYTERPQWGMVIDLDGCIGCNACMVACQSENNVPVVGKKHVGEGREMHWLRIDRYFVAGDEGESVLHEPSLSDPGYAVDSAEMVFQPLPCQHCETAPCEQVCPVGATVHSPDGLNEMTYNRCIGTRYCLNNCPYKVRRFNFFDFHDAPHNPTYEALDEHDKSLLHMAANPNVTVRSRGVMEKCTFCIQRINKARHRANIEDRPIRDGEARTACQQTCPTQAISFGDILDPDSRVTARRGHEDNYTLLDEIYTRPRTSYLPKMRHPNPTMED